ncbi:MAG: putative TPR repeat methyltransferase [Gammaproteobacteria bacterium]|jgi:predicted TPR repeat methyltransferase
MPSHGTVSIWSYRGHVFDSFSRQTLISNQSTHRKNAMTIQNTGKAILENAYNLQTPDDNIAYYDQFATVYDDEFALDMGWCYPQAIAEVFLELALPGDLPVADIGCGTGLIADHLNIAADTIEGFDISAAMLSVAEKKATYGNLHQVDLTNTPAEYSNRYGAIISAGTFTHGHLGPDNLVELLAIGRPDSLFVIGVNQYHYETLNFAEVIDRLVTESEISPVKIHEISMYSKPGHDHSQDVALALVFRKI